MSLSKYYLLGCQFDILFGKYSSICVKVTNACKRSNRFFNRDFPNLDEENDRFFRVWKIFLFFKYPNNNYIENIQVKKKRIKDELMK